MALGTGLNLQILVNNSAKADVTELTVNGNSGQNAIETLDGLSGFSDGPKSIEIDFQQAVMLGKSDHLDAMDDCANGTLIELQIPAGVRSVVSKGIWESFTLGQSTGDGAKFSAKFRGELTATK